MAKASRSAVAPYTVEPTTDGCDVIRPRFRLCDPKGQSRERQRQSRRSNSQARRQRTLKLSATYLNGLAVAVFAVGGFARSYRLRWRTTPLPAVLLLMVVCWIASGVLHSVARMSLKACGHDDGTLALLFAVPFGGGALALWVMWLNRRESSTRRDELRTEIGLFTALLLGPGAFVAAGALVNWFTAWQDQREAAIDRGLDGFQWIQLSVPWPYSRSAASPIGRLRARAICKAPTLPRSRSPA